MTPIYQLFPGVLRANILLAMDRLSRLGGWGDNGWWKPNNIAAAKWQIREEGFVVRRKV